MKLAIAFLLLIATPAFAVEKLEADGVARATIISQEQAEITAESGTPVYDKDGNIMQVVF